MRSAPSSSERMIAEEEALKKKKTTKAPASNLLSAAWETDGRSDRSDLPRPARKGVAEDAAAVVVVVIGHSIRDIPLADSSRRRPLPPPKRRREDTECDVVRVGRAAADVVEDDERDGDGVPDDELERRGDEPMPPPPDCGDCTLPTVVVDCRPDDDSGGEGDEVRVPHDPHDLRRKSSLELYCSLLLLLL